jgi:hypothetical protein
MINAAVRQLLEGRELARWRRAAIKERYPGDGSAAREIHRMTTPYYDPPRTPQLPPPAPKSTLARRLTIFVGIAAFLFGIGVGRVPRRSPTPAVSPS